MQQKNKKRNKQQKNSIDNADESEDSTKSGDDEPYCTHFLKSIDLNKLRKIANQKFKNECTSCSQDLTIADPKNEELDSDDEATIEPPQQWICLKCGHIGCGRTQNIHALKHYDIPRSDSHCIAVDTREWDAWCYKCDERPVNNYSKHKAEFRKKLNEVTEILKKGLKTNISIESKTPLYQNDKISVNIEKDKVNQTLDVPKVGGLTNLGNTCFFNSVLQCLAQTPFLIKVLDDLQVPEQDFILPGGKFKGVEDKEIDLPPIKGTLNNDLNFTPLLRKTLTQMQNSNGQVYRPSELLNFLRRKSVQCTDGGQHDSHEILRHLLENIRNEDLKRYQEIILRDTGMDNKSRRKIDDNGRLSVKYYGNQANAKFLGPERVFRGELVSTLQCLECNHTSPRTEPFLDLSLPILIDKSSTSLLNYKRKNSSFDKSVESVNNNISDVQKNESKKAQRKHKAQNKNNKNLTAHNASQEKKNNESEESDADVEDNTNEEDASTSRINNSDESSQLASPVSLAVLRCTDKSSVVSSLVNGGIDLANSSQTSFLSSADDRDSLEKEDSSKKKDETTKKLSNGYGDIASKLSKLDLSSPKESPRRYQVKEGECSIQLCLNQFTVLEHLTGNNKVGCEACTKKEKKNEKEKVKMVCTDSTKQYLISRVPAVLILHLKRFQVQKFNSRKVGKHVSFPMLLDLSPVCKNCCTKPRMYALYGIVEHSGTMYGGHYVAYVKSRAPLKPDDPRWEFLPSKDGFENKDDSNESSLDIDSDESSETSCDAENYKIEPPPGKWYYVSDSRVQEVDEKTVLNSEAYLLFYERIS